MLKIKVVTPVYRYMEVETMKSLMTLSATSKNQLEWYPPEGDSFIQRVRNRACMDIEGFDYLMFIDDDISWDLPFNPVDKLAEQGKDLIGGIYCIRGGNFHPVFLTDEQYKLVLAGKADQIIWEVPDQTFEVKHLGTGFMLISAKLLKEIYATFKYPFMSFVDEAGDELSEDYAFCTRARQLGYKIFADGQVRLCHTGKKAYTLEDYHNAK